MIGPLPRMASTLMAVVIGAGALGCDGDARPAHRGTPASAAGGALQEGPTIAFDTGLDRILCAAAVSCEPELLEDPFTGVRATSLVLEYICRADQSGAAVRDAFETIQRRMVCYDDGDPSAPETWRPRAGREVVPLREETYSGLVDPWGDAQFNLAVLPLDALGHAFCRFEAWGLFASTPVAAGERAVSHAQHVPFTHWEVFIQAAGDDDFDCHLQDGDVSSLRFGSAASVTYTRPSPSAAGVYPRRQSFALVLDALVDGPDAPSSVHGLRVVYGLDADFPADTHDRGGGAVTRDLVLDDPDGGPPLEVAAGRSCADVDADGELDAIAVEVLDWWTRVPVGAVVVRDSLDGDRFDCERAADGATCRLFAPDEYASAAPCLAAP